MTEQEQEEKDEKTDADVDTGRHEDWEGEDRTEVDAHPPADRLPERAPELAKPRLRPGA